MDNVYYCLDAPSRPHGNKRRIRTRQTHSGWVSQKRRTKCCLLLVCPSILKQTQTQPGIFHMLPLGLRVQEKIEKLLDKHMHSIGAARLALSSLSSAQLWEQSGRLSQVSGELFQLEDRKKHRFLLAPTHEEEITALVAAGVNSYKHMPLRLYQTTRKYRDEIRPRHGLLRSREFLMKDLYSFDWSYEKAFETYNLVAKAYQQFFKDLNLPIVVAEASSGDMGGKLSHEYHLTSPIGSDTIYTCKKCDYASNDEVASPRLPAADEEIEGEAVPAPTLAWTGVTTDRRILVNVWIPKDAGDPNIHAIKAAAPDLDTTLSGQPAHQAWEDQHKSTTAGGPPQVKQLIDGRLTKAMTTVGELLDAGEGHTVEKISQDEEGQPLNLVCLKEGDACPRCDGGKVQTHRALELGHTFYLGTRYSEPFSAKVAAADPKKPKVTLSMGCYGLGISRIFAALVEHFATEKGLQWPVAIAPFHVYVVPTMEMTDEAWKLYDAIATGKELGKALDVVVDDRKVSFGWKMNDAETIGYPIRVVLGKKFQKDGICEVHVHKYGTRTDVSVGQAPAYIAEQIRKLEQDEGVPPQVQT